MSTRIGLRSPLRLLVIVRPSATNPPLRFSSRFVLRPSSTSRPPSYQRSFTRAYACRRPTPPPHPPPPGATTATRLENGVSLATVSTGVITAVALLGFLAWQGYARDSPVDTALNSQSALLSTTNVPLIRLYPGMPAEIPPGRPGNLTADQEAKLKELWELLHQITNPSSRRNSTVEPNGVAQPPSPESQAANGSPSDAAKKKRRFGSLLGRNRDRDSREDSDSQSVYSASSSAAGGEDRHGQNKEYREALSKMSAAELREALWTFSKADDPDANLCRYLRARKWNVQNALVMLISTIHWRRNIMRLDEDVMRYGEESALEARNGNPDADMDETIGRDFMAQLHMGKSFMHGSDKDGRPMCFVRVRLHHGGEQSVAALERYTVWTIETARFMLRPPIDTAVLVFDMTGFTMANMDYTPVKFMIKVFEANYPESLGYVFVHKAPWVFQGVWRLIRGWLDPVVASKIHFTSDAAQLSQYVDMDKIPKELGGTEDWEYSYEGPVPGENATMKDTATRDALLAERWEIIAEHERLTEEWVAGSGPTPPHELAGRRLDVAQKLRDNYWRLDPYVRARTLYDRQGIIHDGGYINMYPESRGDGGDDAGDGNSIYYDAQSEWD